MVDLIEELLREQEDGGEDEEELDWERAAPLPRRRSAAAEPDGKESGRQAEPPGEPERKSAAAAGVGEAFGEMRAGAPGREEHADWERVLRPWAGTVMGARPAAAADAAGARGYGGAESLYTELRKTAEAARYGREVRHAGESAVRSAGESAALPALERWDERIQRDARRYDGSFALF